MCVFRELQNRPRPVCYPLLNFVAHHINLWKWTIQLLRMSKRHFTTPFTKQNVRCLQRSQGIRHRSAIVHINRLLNPWRSVTEVTYRQKRMLPSSDCRHSVNVRESRDKSEVFQVFSAYVTILVKNMKLSLGINKPHRPQSEPWHSKHFSRKAEHLHKIFNSCIGPSCNFGLIPLHCCRDNRMWDQRAAQDTFWCDTIFMNFCYIYHYLT